MKLHFPTSLGRLAGLLLAAVPSITLAQTGSLGVGTSTPHPSAALEVASTGKGLLLPRLTQAQRTAIGGPAPGLIVYQTDGVAGFWYYSGTQWLPLQSSGADNLGNHTATQNLNLGTNRLVGNGGTHGLIVAFDGQIRVSTPNPGSGITSWIASNVGGSAGDRVVSGLLNGVATVGGHDYGLTAWAPLALNPGGGNVGIGTSAPSQPLEVAGQVFSSAGGFRFPDNTVQTTAAAADNLGNHTATQNLNLGANQLVGNGGTSGLRISNNGNVGVGTLSTPINRLHVDGGDLRLGEVRWGSAADDRFLRIGDGNYVTIGEAGANDNLEFRADNFVFMSSTASYAGNVGIGTPTPTARLDVSGNGGLRVYTTNPGMGYGDWFSAFGGVAGKAMPRVVLGTLEGVATIGGYSFTSGNFGFNWSNLALNPDGGNVGIGTFTPGERLHVVGNAYVQGNVTLTGQFTSVGTVSFCGGAYTCSDRRYKKEITPLRWALENVLKLNGYTYFWKQAEFPEKQFTADRQLGFIAQEVEALYPEMVMTDPRTGYKSVDYARMTPVLLEAIKELNTKLEAANERAARAEAAAAAATNTLTSFETRLRALETGGTRAGAAEASLPRK